MIITNDITTVMGALPESVTLALDVVEEPKQLPDTVNICVTDAVLGMMLAKKFYAGALLPATPLAMLTTLQHSGDRCYWIRRKGTNQMEWRELRIIV